MDCFQFKYNILSEEELSLKDSALLKASFDVIRFSHSPYSNFRVACAVRMTDGSIISGTNQENAAYPSGLCAERVALFSAKSKSNKDIDAILVLASNEEGKMADAYACGSCRQVMIEYASQQNKAIRILMRKKDGKFIEVKDVKDLLPFSFSSTSLNE